MRWSTAPEPTVSSLSFGGGCPEVRAWASPAGSGSRGGLSPAALPAPCSGRWQSRGRPQIARTCANRCRDETRGWSGASRHSAAFIYVTAEEYRLKATGAGWPSYRRLTKLPYKLMSAAQHRDAKIKAYSGGLVDGDGRGVPAKKSAIAANGGYVKSKGAFAPLAK